jgi:hypothetical protein
MFLTQVAQALGIPIIIVIMELATKLRIRRPHRGKGISMAREDLQVGFNWILGALVSLLLFTLDRLGRYTSSIPHSIEMQLYYGAFFTRAAWVGAATVFVLAVVPPLVQHFGYSKRGRKYELRWGIGVIMPDLIGLCVLVAVFWTGATNP